MIGRDEIAGSPVTDDPAGWAFSQSLVPPTGEPAYKIAKAWDASLIPMLKSAGFAGKSRDFVRDDGEMTYAVNLQPFHHGSSFTIELAIDPWRGREGGPASVRTISAPFRARLMADGREIWWTYGRDRESMEAAASAAAVLCARHLADAFDSLRAYISGGDAEQDETALGLIGQGHVDIARYRAAKSDPDAAARFAQKALGYLVPDTPIYAEMGELASSLRP